MKKTRSKTSVAEAAIALMLKHGLTSLEIPGFKATRDPTVPVSTAKPKPPSAKALAEAEAAALKDEQDLLYYSCGGTPKKDPLHG